MARRHQTDVLVAGAGPVGLLAALLLSQRGLSVEIVDEAWRQAARSYALALHPRTLELLDSAGLADDLIAAGRRVETVAFYQEHRRCAELRLWELPGRFPFLLTLAQSTLEEMLLKALAERKVKVRWNHRVSGLEAAEDGGSRVRIERLVKESSGYGVALTEWVVDKSWDVASRFVVGADGHRSAVRRALGAPFERVALPQVFAVFEVHTAKPAGEEMRVVVDGETCSVLWPLGDRHCRWSFELEDGDAFAEGRTKRRLAVQIADGAYPQLGVDDLTGLIDERAPWFEAEIEQVDWSVAVRFEHRLAESFGKGTVRLAGDSAHLTGPVGVRSMNAGMAEAHELAEGIVAIAGSRQPIGSLDAIGSGHREAWLRWTGDAGGLSATETTEDWVRNHLAAVAPCIPATGRHYELLADQLGLAPAS